MMSLASGGWVGLLSDLEGPRILHALKIYLLALFTSLLIYESPMLIIFFIFDPAL